MKPLLNYDDPEVMEFLRKKREHYLKKLKTPNGSWIFGPPVSGAKIDEKSQVSFAKNTDQKIMWVLKMFNE